METDPYFVREILTLFICYLMISSFFDPFNSNLSREGIFLLSSSSGLFFMPLIYSVVVAGLFARSLEHGSFGFLLTLPVRRNTIIIHYILVAVIAEVSVFSIPVLFTDYLTYSTISLEPLIFIVLSLFTFSFLYISTGYLVAAISRNSLLTMIVVFGIFLSMDIYSTSLFPKSSNGQFLFSGVSFFSHQLNIPLGLYYSIAVVTILGILFTFLAHITLRFKGVRSGR